jgi:hypothetical protein
MFRVAGRRPELWWPDTGRIECPAVYEERDGLTRVPIHFDPSGSVFVVFRRGDPPEADRVVAVTPAAGDTLRLTRSEAGIEAEATEPGDYTLTLANGSTRQLRLSGAPMPLNLAGPWEVTFDSNWGGPAQPVIFTGLDDWSTRSEDGIKFYSGTAVYRKRFDVPPTAIGGSRSAVYLDLGKVAVMAEVRLNGRDLGILWKPPFRVEVTEALKPGENSLEVKVVNLWINRQIGDAHLSEDSERNPNGTLKSWPAWLLEGKPSPTGRFSFTSWRLLNKDSPLVESGLLGPVTLQFAERCRLP